ncbi:MAG: DUF1080 domain-containing protein, partial [Chloroflexi bacterium]|nr:DUF1080 domain-containing protein [Chloroflexota bacterium]
ELAVLVHKQTYDILVNGKVMQPDIPLQYVGGGVALTTWFSSVAFDNVYVIPVVPSFAESDSTAGAAMVTNTPEISSAISPAIPAMPAGGVARSNFGKVTADMTETKVLSAATTALNGFFSEKFPDKADQTRWITSSGEWRFEAGALVQQKPDGYDHNILTVGQFSKFTLRTTFRHRQGSGGGVIFNLPDPTTKSNSHLVRYFEDDGLVWGYFDAKGVFVGQGHSPVAAPGDQPHTLQVSVDGATYLVMLDNQLVAKNIPLLSKQGHIGLTASQSIVAFESVDVTALAPVQK